ncbi:hypothetical protein V6Z11_D03G208300 [Gossypium hirsutum]
MKLKRHNLEKPGIMIYSSTDPISLKGGEEYDLRRTQLDMQDCRQWVNSRMEDRRAEPCEFSQTAPPHKPFDSVSNATFSGSPCNPRIVSFLELLDLPYVLDNASDYRDTPASLPQKGKEFSIYLVPLSFDDVIASGM